MSKKKELKDIQKDFEPIFMKFFRDKGIIQPGQKIGFEWKKQREIKWEKQYLNQMKK